LIVIHLTCITAALVIDHFIGDPPSWPHPVRWFGSLITWLENQLNKGSGRKVKGVLMLSITALIPFSVTLILLFGAYRFHIVFGVVLESVILATTIAQNGLASAAENVYKPLAGGNIEAARKQTALIVGRDTDSLDEQELTRAAVETVAENISDGITVPLFWAVIGGAPFAILYRAVNTCDSMAGYKNDRYKEFGWASARFDDVLNWLPARLTGFTMLLAGSVSTREKFRYCRHLQQEARKHPSPNSGWGEAAAALLLGVQLGGVNYYNGMISDRPKMGKKLYLLEKRHITKMITIMKRTVRLFLLLLWIGGGLVAITKAWF
jgi:adenosylcobinamide-phosphate synthase